MKFSYKGFDDENAVSDFAEEFSLEFGADGVQVCRFESEELSAKYDGESVRIGCSGGKGFWRALSMAADMPQGEPFEIREEYGLRDLGLMADCSRGAVPTVDTLKRLIRYMAALGYTSLQLYTEDIFEVEGEPFFGYLRGRYSKEELRALDAYAAAFGIELIPCVQTLAHFSAPTRWQPFCEGKHDINDILLVGEEKTYEFIEKIFRTMRDCFRSKNIHIGMDEAHMLGLGKYLDKHGYVNRFDILCSHLGRVATLAEKYGFTPMMWSDMFFRLAFGGEYYARGGSVPAEVRAKVPNGVKLVYWDYYSTDEARYNDMFRAHKEFGSPVVFAGGFWTWKGFTPHNGFSIEATRAALASAKRSGIDSAFFTMWGDNGAECPLFAVLPSIVTAAEYVYGHDDIERIADRFGKLAGMKFDDFMTADLPDILEGDNRDLKNPSKYLLYSDPLMGIFDCTTDERDGELYAKHAEKLQAFSHHSKWGYIFAAAESLCRVLAVKANLGNETHEAYASGDKEKLSRIAEHDYGALLEESERFLRLFRTAWRTENKPQGLEVNETRLGGLYARIACCREVLREYLRGETASIPELEEPRVDLSGEKEFSRKHVTHNCWANTFTGGIS